MTALRLNSLFCVRNREFSEIFGVSELVAFGITASFQRVVGQSLILITGNSLTSGLRKQAQIH